MTDLDPAQTVALFDSATVLRSSLEAALRGQPFPQLGNSSGVGRAARTGGKLPWPLLRRIYTRIGAAEGLDPGGLSDVNMLPRLNGAPTRTSTPQSGSGAPRPDARCS